ncbi:DUF4058 family protein [soil metagenome]
MPSPFPGMNPYLEGTVWPDFHHRAITRIADVLESQLPANYDVNIEETVFIHELSAEERRPFSRPDVNVTATGERLSLSGATATLDAPTKASVPDAILEEVHAFLEIRDGRDRQVVTVIELLSLANKDRGGGGEQYLAKLRKTLSMPTHFVEIDLLRGGRKTPWVGLTPSMYSVVISRHDKRPSVDVWPINLRDHLPKIPIPTRLGDPEPVVDLQEVLNSVYDATRYRRTIYENAPIPPLAPADLAWVVGIVDQTNK